VNEEAQLIAAIAANPDDEAPRLVYADWLIARGDRRGELIVLDHLERTTPGGLVHPDQLVSLLRLAAELGFPHIPDPDAALLAFDQIGRSDCYRVFHAGARYTLRREDNELSLQRGDDRPIFSEHYKLMGAWSDRATTVMLAIALDAIRTGAAFERVGFPDHVAIRSHRDYRIGPFPMYFSAEIVEDFERDHLLRARDHARWYAIYDRLMAGFSPTSHR
jgi:uncharacterized protein (TIGR02996 family)